MAIEIGAVFSDLSYRPQITQTGDVKTVINDNAIKQAVLTILYTPKGSRLFEPDFGCNIRSYLFEPLDAHTAAEIQETIKSSLTRWEPRIKEVDVVVTPIYDKNQYIIEISYQLIEINRYDAVTVSLERL